MTQGDPERKAAEGVGIGIGLGIGGPLTAFVAVLLTDPSRDWTFGAYALGALVGTVGVAGALMDFSKLRADDAYETIAVAALMAGLAAVLLGLAAVDVVSGVAGGVATGLGLVAVLFAVVFLGMGVSQRLAAPSNRTGATGRPPPVDGRRLSPYEVMTLVVGVLGAVGSFVGAFTS